MKNTVTIARLPGQEVFSPRKRGWSELAFLREMRRLVLPAQAGVVRDVGTRRQFSRGSPRASGGGPATSTRSRPPWTFSPRKRGWSLWAHGWPPVPGVLPAHAGVVPFPACRPRSSHGSPRASGGGPAAGDAASVCGVLSPRKRGWSVVVAAPAAGVVVLPAQAGVVVSRRARGRSSSWSGGGAARTGGGQSVKKARRASATGVGSSGWWPRPGGPLFGCRAAPSPAVWRWSGR
jgi:hypothetical protein